jgi:hypothetical protein
MTAHVPVSGAAPSRPFGLGSDGSADDFAAPGPDNAPAAYWFWHRIPTRDEVRDQVSRIAQAGYGSFQIQTRMSFPLDQYLSAEYLDMCAYAADRARAQGLVMGIYDEYNWLSGHAGGRTVAGRDELRERHLFHASATVEHGRAELEISGIVPTDVSYLTEAGMAWVFEDRRPRWDRWQLVGALLDAPPVGPDDVRAWVTEVDGRADGCRVTLTVPDGVAVPDHARVTVLLGARCASSRMINYLLPEAAERFTEVGLDPYARAFGDHLGPTVRYVFFDQPHACFFTWDQNDGPFGATLMYDKGFYAELAADVGPDWPAMLRALARDDGDVDPRTASLRARFLEAYAVRGTEAFLGTLHAWCAAHGIVLTGHEVLGHVSGWDLTGTIIADDPRPNFAMDYFGIDAHRDVTAVDARNDAPQLSAKMGDSVARSHGRSGCLIEQYFGRVVPGSHFGAGWWELTLGQLRDQTVRHHVLGARQLLMHAFWLTDGHEGEEMFTNPRFDFAPGINFEPWFGMHRLLADESARISVFLDGTAPLCEVAVLYPLRTAWAHGQDHPLGEHGAFWTEHLARSGVDHHLIDERDLRAATPTPDGLRLADGRVYPTVVLPAVQVLADAGSTDILAAHCRLGGRVVSTGPLPDALQHGSADEVRAMREQIGTLVADGSWIAWSELPRWDLAHAAVVRERLDGLQVEDTAPGQGQLWVRRGTHPGPGDGDPCRYRLLLFNDADTSRTVLVRSGTRAGTVTDWDPTDGTVGDPVDVGPTLPVVLAPRQVRLLEIAPTGEPVPAQQLLATGWTLEFPERPELGRRPVDPSRGWEQQGLGTISGIGRYRIEVEAPTGDSADDWELVLPVVHGSASVALDGRHLADVPWAPDRVEIPSEDLHPGPHTLTVDVASSAANHYYAGTGLQGDGTAPSGLGAVPILRPRL